MKKSLTVSALPSAIFPPKPFTALPVATGSRHVLIRDWYYFAIAATTIDALQRELEKPDLAFEERRSIMDRILTVNEQVSGQVTEGQKFIHRGQIIVGFSIGLCIGAVAVILGVNTKIKTAKP